MAGEPTLIIEVGRTERHYWKDLWRYRELFYFLAWRDILVRYKQTVNGSVCRTSRGKLRNNRMTAIAFQKNNYMVTVGKPFTQGWPEPVISSSRE
jgi:lipopolysaccharide transport system permease protein